MANKNLFKSSKNSSFNTVDLKSVANARNAAGGAAFAKSDEEALATIACTGTFNGTYYSNAESVLNTLLSKVSNVRPEFLAKLAVYSTEKGFMKDSPALLLACLMVLDNDLFKRAFPRIVRNGKMLKNFCQIVRSGVVGRKSFGSSAKRLIQNWLNARSDKQLFEDSIGNEPSLADVIKMVHPKPLNENRAAYYAYLLGKEHSPELLPDIVKEFESFKRGKAGDRVVPNVSFQHLTACELSEKEWASIAKNASFTAMRMNLSTYQRHGVFNDPSAVEAIVSKLSSPEAVQAAKVFPYQIYTSYLNADSNIPASVREALSAAMETATKNVPHLRGNVLVGVDCSGSMMAPVTGTRGTATTKVSCNQVGSLIAACVIRNSDSFDAYRFDTEAQRVNLNPANSVIDNAKLIGSNGGGTDCSSVLREANAKNIKADTVFIVSDNESWSSAYRGNSTASHVEWKNFKKRNPNAKLILIDLAAEATTQVASNKDVLNVAGFSDNVFESIEAFLSGTGNWITKIEEIQL